MLPPNLIGTLGSVEPERKQVKSAQRRQEAFDLAGREVAAIASLLLNDPWLSPGAGRAAAIRCHNVRFPPKRTLADSALATYTIAKKGAPSGAPLVSV
jgi:hypothetical protein